MNELGNNIASSMHCSRLYGIISFGLILVDFKIFISLQFSFFFFFAKTKHNFAVVLLSYRE